MSRSRGVGCRPLQAGTWALALCVLGPAAARAGAQDVAAAVRRAEAAGLRTSVCVRDVDRGGVVFAHGADVLRPPASNQKLLVALAFLDALGPDYRFRTGFRLEGGRLVVSAGGDPNWITGGPVDPRETFAGVARALRDAGVRAVRELVLEPGPFTGPARPDGWPADQLHFWYGAPTGGVVLDQGCWVVSIGPGDHDALVRVLSPAGLGLSGRILMTSDRREGGIYHLELRDDRLAMRGHLWNRAEERPVRGAIDEPERRFLGALEQALRAGGIAVDPAAPAAELELPDVTSPLEPALLRTLHHSSNFDAEQLLRVLGAEVVDDGSFDGGLRALRGVLARVLGPLPDGVRLADGSGLSRENRASASFLTAALVAAARGPRAEEFVAAVPRPGDPGTLEKRFRGSPVAARVRAKTGSLNGASALSGFLQTRDGRLLAFSILMEWSRPVKGTGPKREQERIVAALDEPA